MFWLGSANLGIKTFRAVSLAVCTLPPFSPGRVEDHCSSGMVRYCGDARAGPGGCRVQEGRRGRASWGLFSQLHDSYNLSCSRETGRERPG